MFDILRILLKKVFPSEYARRLLFLLVLTLFVSKQGGFFFNPLELFILPHVPLELGPSWPGVPAKQGAHQVVNPMCFSSSITL